MWLGRGTPPIVGPRLSQEVEKESLLVCLPHSLSGCGAESSGAGYSAPRNSPSFPAVPFSRREACEGRAGKAAALSRAQLDARRRGAGAQSAGDRAGAGSSRRGRHPLSLHLSRPPSIWLGFLLRAYCARRVPPAHRGRSGAPARPAPILPSRPRLFLGVAAPVGPGCVLANCASGIVSGVPPWLAIGFSPVLLSPCPRSHAAAPSPAVPGARVLFVSSKAVSIYRRHCNPAVCKVSITAMRSTRPTAHARRLRSTLLGRPERKKLWSGVCRHPCRGAVLDRTRHANSNDPMQRNKAVKGAKGPVSPSSALHLQQRVLADQQALETALFDLLLVILTTLGCRLDISLAYIEAKCHSAVL